jgi:hypothetical protein
VGKFSGQQRGNLNSIEKENEQVRKSYDIKC